MDPAGRPLRGRITSFATSQGPVYTPTALPSPTQTLLAASPSSTVWGNPTASSIADSNGDTNPLPETVPAANQVMVFRDQFTPAPLQWRYQTQFPFEHSWVSLAGVSSITLNTASFYPPGFQLRRLDVNISQLSRDTSGDDGYVGIQLLDATLTPVTTGYVSTCVKTQPGANPRGGIRYDCFYMFNDDYETMDLHYSLARRIHYSAPVPIQWFGSMTGRKGDRVIHSGGVNDANVTVKGLRLFVSDGLFTSGLISARIDVY